MDSASGCQPAEGVTSSSVVVAKAEDGSPFPTSKPPSQPFTRPRNGSSTDNRQTDNSFGKEHRLADFRLIRRAKRYGSRQESDHFQLFRLENSGEVTQFCLRAGRKLGNAPQRNRMRRLLREFLRTNKGLWPEQSAIVIEVKKAFPEAKLAEITPELAELLAEACRNLQQRASQ